MNSREPYNIIEAIQQALMVRTIPQFSQHPMIDLNDLSNNRKHDQKMPEVYVIGLQEMPKDNQAVNHLKLSIQAVLGPFFALISWHAVGELSASIWIRRELLWSCTLVSTNMIHFRPSPANQIKTKGALSLSFNLFGTSFLFINTHLSAHEENVKVRLEQIEKLMQEHNIGEYVLFDKQKKQPECIFFFGDLNFRLESSIGEVKSLIDGMLRTGNNGKSA